MTNPHKDYSEQQAMDKHEAWCIADWFVERYCKPPQFGLNSLVYTITISNANERVSTHWWEEDGIQAIEWCPLIPNVQKTH